MKKLLIMILLTISVFGANLKVGDSFDYNFQDQFEKQLTVTEKTKQIIISFSKDNGAIVKEFLAKNKDYLSKTNSVYLVDVHSVPSFVMSFFMRPKFKDYNFKMGLIDDEKIASSLPFSSQKITLLTLENKKIISIKFVDSLK